MPHTILSRRGYVIKKDDIEEDDIATIKRDLTVTPFIPADFQLATVPTFKVFLESRSSLFLPKSYGLKKYGPPSNNKLIDVSESNDINIEFKGGLRADQMEPIQAFMEAANDPARMGGILNLQCAAGKTVMAIYLICQLKKKAIVLVHKEFLIQQWKERIQEFAPEARIGLIKAKVIDVEDKDIILASLQSLSMKEYDAEVFRGIGFLIADECHHTGAEVFSRALLKVNTQYTLGLSATVKRKDGLSKVFMWHLGDIVFSRKQNKTDIIQVNMQTFQSNNPDYCEEAILFGTKPNMAKMINNICAFPLRVTFLCKAITTSLTMEPQRRVLVLSDRRNHLHDIKNELLKDGCTSSIGFYYGGMKQEQLKESEGADIILGTFSMISEGFDVKGLDTLVLASPKSDVIQSVGRILREKPECRKHQPLVIDIVDDFSMFPRQAKKRHEYYKSCKYDISYDKIERKQVTNKLVEIEGFAFAAV